MNYSQWKTAKLDKLKLLDKEVHLWKANLDVFFSQIVRLKNTLSADEKIRADRFQFDIHKNRFIAARGFLRKILSCYLEISEEEIVFEYSDRGKPMLAYNNIQFNVSHSENIALYAITKDKSIGIDIEYLRSNIECCKIARRFFNFSEYQLIKNIEPQKQPRAFYSFWTAKEAYLKATGEGLIGGLDTVEIELNRENHINIVSISQNTAVNNWFFYSFIPQNDFMATVVVENKHPLTIQQFTLN